MSNTEEKHMETLTEQDREALTEDIRRQLVVSINARPGSREALAAKYGSVWDTGELSGAFDVVGFLAPFVVVRRKSDGRKGSVEFQHDPRFYFNFLPDAD